MYILAVAYGILICYLLIMRKNILTLALLTSTIFIISCGSDDGPAPTHEIGTWGLDSYVWLNLPAEFASAEGAIFDISQITFGGIPFQSYVFTLSNDGNYSREIEVAGPDFSDAGTWTLEGDDFTFVSDDLGFDEIFRVEQNEDDQFWLAEEAVFTLLSDAIADSLNNLPDSVTVTQEEVNALASQVTLDLVYVFERQ